MTLQTNKLNTNTAANCPLFLEWLSFMFAERLTDGTYDPDSESCANNIEFVRALLRFALAPEQYDEVCPVKIVCVFGQLKTGKTTFLEIFQELAGKNYDYLEENRQLEGQGIASFEINRRIKQVDPVFKAKLKQELPGICDWVMQISFNDAITRIAAHQCSEG